MTDADHVRLVLIRSLATCGLLFVLAACGSDSAAVGPDPDPDPDPDPVDTEPDLECGLPDHPCAWSDVSASVIDRTLDLADQGLAMLGDGSTSADVDAWLDAQGDVVEVQSDALAIRFRVDGGRGMWIYREGATLSGPGPGAAPLSVARESAGTPERHVVGDASAKRALVLSPALWHLGDEWDDGAEVAAIFEATRGYEGGVVYRKNETETATEVGPAAFTDWNTFDVVHYTGHGRRVCDPSGCRAALSIGELANVIPSGDSEAAKILQLDQMGLELRIGEETGNKYVLVAADFFRDAYPNGLEKTVVFLNGCQTLGSQALDLAQALQGGTSVILGWSDAVYADDAMAASLAFWEALSEQGYPTEVAWEKLGDLRTGKPGTKGDGTAPVLGLEGPTDGSDLRVREVVTVLSPYTGAELTSEDHVGAVGVAGDGQPDAAPYRVLVEGVLEEHAGDMMVHVTVDGIAAEPIPLTDGTKNDDDAWELDGNVGLPYDLTEDREVVWKATTTLHDGGESEHQRTATLTAAEPLLGTTWEMTAKHTTHWMGYSTPYYATATILLTFEPGQDPMDPEPDYVITGGTISWDYSHASDECTRSAPALTFDLEEANVFSRRITFDATQTPVTATGWIRTQTPWVTVSVECENTSHTREHRDTHIWFEVGSDDPDVVQDGELIRGTRCYVQHHPNGTTWTTRSDYVIRRLRPGDESSPPPVHEGSCL